MSTLTWILNTGLMGALLPSSRAFEAALRDPEAAQAERLAAVLRAVEGSEQARTLGVRSTWDARTFQNAVPLSDAQALRPSLEALAAGKLTTLTGVPPVRFEASGGSSGAHKHLPMTEALLGEFQQALAPWLFDLLSRRPALRRGAAYWSISPIGSGRMRTLGGLPVGSDSDSSYLPGPLRPLMERVLAVPGFVARLPDVVTCRYVTLRCLLARDDLALMSIWNPSFLTLLLEQLEEHGARLHGDLERGGCRPPRPDGANADWDAAVQEVCGTASWPSAPAAASRLRRALSVPATQRIRILWPRLSLVSCWADADADRALLPLERALEGVEVQPKGLLATEGVVTVPRFGAPAPVLAVRSHFYEFLPESFGPQTRPLLAHELEDGATYQVLVSTSGGLLRYRLGDRVRVEGHLHRTPCLRLLGRADAVVDLVGEKLSQAHVGAVLEATLREHGRDRMRFAMLAPEWRPSPGYRLFLEGALSDAELAVMAASVERRLCEGHTYGYARALGQLTAIEPVRVQGGTAAYEARCIALGQRAGDIKPVALHRLPGWRECFAKAALSPHTADLLRHTSDLHRLPAAPEAGEPDAPDAPAAVAGPSLRDAPVPSAGPCNRGDRHGLRGQSTSSAEVAKSPLSPPGVGDGAASSTTSST